MWRFFENHEIPYSLKGGSVVKLPVRTQQNTEEIH